VNGNSSILLVGFDPKPQETLTGCLREHYQVLSAASSENALALLERGPADLILCCHHPEDDRIQLLETMRIRHPEMIRLLQGDLNDDQVFAAINRAAIFQFVPSGWVPQQIELLIRRALENRELAYRHRHISHELKFADDVLVKVEEHSAIRLENGYQFDNLIYRNKEMAELCAIAQKAAATELPVLIHGETGTGKELLARAVHSSSSRREHPLMVQNCGGMSDELLHSELFGHCRGAFTGAISDRLGLFQAADGGTVFLDEISEVSPQFQVALLRFLQEGEVKPLGNDRIRTVNVRIIAASNRRLDDLVDAKKFRQDLYFRLKGFELDIPPLRRRLDDVPFLAAFLAKKYASSIGRHILGIAPGIIDILKAYQWPGNVRELENEIQRMVALAENGQYLNEEHLSSTLSSVDISHASDQIKSYIPKGRTLKEKVETLEKMLVRDALFRHRWNQSKAAEELGLSRVGLANKIKRYSLDQATV
jgi:two-component system, NtrC family, response regulator HupR/HoxA